MKMDEPAKNRNPFVRKDIYMNDKQNDLGCIGNVQVTGGGKSVNVIQIDVTRSAIEEPGDRVVGHVVDTRNENHNDATEMQDVYQDADQGAIGNIQLTGGAGNVLPPEPTIYM